ncbi:hypothetical protein G7068_10825 [Leucobacter viscericola]|uniref:Ig-like domain-containing protein n=1 Tax=Leucobacter viscericola TaxID=2714935 RepID=A0A6G7XGG1_9MICO|nr:hypothetical protein [Leucobacter viscericola]QIK63633.1 hypothetical protein G7068_10825 [Leucobacter viscericola]
MTRLFGVIVATSVALVSALIPAAIANAAPPSYTSSSITAPGNLGGGVAVDSSRGLVYFAARFSNAIYAYDTTTLALVATIPVPNQPIDIKVHPTTGHLFVSQYTENSTQGSLSVIDPDTRSIISTLPTGLSPVGVTLSKDNTRLWVGNYSSPFLSVFDTTDPTAVTALPNLPVANSAERVTEAPDGTHLYLMPSSANKILTVDRTSGATTATWTGTYGSPHQVEILPDGLGVATVQLGSQTPVVDPAAGTTVSNLAIANSYYASQDQSQDALFITAPWISGGSVVVVDSASKQIIQTVPASLAFTIATDPVTHRTFTAGINNRAITVLQPRAVAPTVAQDPLDQTVSDGDTATFTAAANSLDPVTTQWQRSSDNGTSWDDVSGETGDSLTVADTTLDMSGYLYRAVFTNSVGSVTTAQAALTVVPVPLTVTSPIDVTVAEGETAEFTSTETGSGPATVQWQSSSDGGDTWSDLAGSTETTITIEHADYSATGSRYRAVFTNPAGQATSDPATLTVTRTTPTPDPTPGPTQDPKPTPDPSTTPDPEPKVDPGATPNTVNEQAQAPTDSATKLATTGAPALSAGLALGALFLLGGAVVLSRSVRARRS